MNVKKAKITHLPEIIKLQKQHKTYPSFWTWLVKAFIEQQAYIYTLKTGEVVGFIIWNNKTLQSIVVDKEHRGKGIGTELVEKTLPETGIQIVKTQPRKKGFYKRFGFKTRSITMVRKNNSKTKQKVYNK